MSIEIGSGTTDKNDWELMHSDDEVRAKKTEQSKKIAEAAALMDGALTVKETLGPHLAELEKTLDLSNPLRRHLGYEGIKRKYQEACDRIEYYRKSPEVLPEERENAMRIYRLYEIMSPSERRKKWGEKWDVGTIMGYKKEWEL